jgi:hypothetical protein
VQSSRITERSVKTVRPSTIFDTIGGVDDREEHGPDNGFPVVVIERQQMERAVRDERGLDDVPLGAQRILQEPLMVLAGGTPAAKKSPNRVKNRRLMTLPPPWLDGAS